MKRLLSWSSNPLFWGLIALVLLLTTSASWLVPGASAPWVAQLVGAWPGGGAGDGHPLVTPLLRLVAIGVPAGRAVAVLNGLAAVAGAGCVAMVVSLAKRYLQVMVEEPRTRPFVSMACRMAAPAAAVGMLCSPLFWRLATHCQWQVFDLLLLLGVTLLLLRVAEGATLRRMQVAAFCGGLVAIESTALLLVMVAFPFALGVAYFFKRERVYLRDFMMSLALPFALGGGTGLLVAWLPQFCQGQLTLSVCWRFFLLRWVELNGLFQDGWLLLMLLAIVPFVVLLFLSRDIGMNRRSTMALLTYLSAAVLTVLAFLPLPFNPLALAEQWGDAVLAVPMTMMALSVALLVGLGRLLQQVKTPPEGGSEVGRIRFRAAFVGCYSVLAVGLVVPLFGGWASLQTRLADRALEGLAKDYADALMGCARMDETWLLGDGTAEVYLATRIYETKTPIVLIPQVQLTAERPSPALLKRLESSPYFAQKPELQQQLIRSLNIGVLPFLRDWLRADEEATQRFVTLSRPEIWFIDQCVPLPEKFWHRGARSREAQLRSLQAMPFPGVLGEVQAEARPARAHPALQQFAEYRLHQASFVANNIAYFLLDANQLEAGYQRFCTIGEADPENLSVLLNRLALALGPEQHPEWQSWGEREVKKLSQRLETREFNRGGRRPYQTLQRLEKGRGYREVWLARTSGFVVAPQTLVRLFGDWVMSGSPPTLEIFNPAVRELLQRQADIYYSRIPGKRQEAIARYRSRLARASDPTQRLSDIRQIFRMMLIDGNLPEARGYLEEAEALVGTDEMGYERALYWMAMNNPANAYQVLTQFIANHPAHIDGLAMLATLQLQTGDLKPLKEHTLPKMMTAAKTEDNYFVQVILAQIAEQEGNLPRARACYLRALALKPEVYALCDTILTLDMRLADKVSAEQHARKFLAKDRSHPLANYVMGSLALESGDLKQAENYLVAATDATLEQPIPAAFNDLAETYRRLGQWEPALEAARRAAELEPSLAVAYETIAMARLKLGHLAEAEAAIQRALALDAESRPNAPRDPRLLLTQARIALANHRADLARINMVEVKRQLNLLDKHAKAEFDELARTLGIEP